MDTDTRQSPAAALEQLLAIMARLRDPKNGCPWDLDQSFRTIVPHTIEEAYEVADAIENEHWAALPGELGDLLFQVVFYAQMASEEGRFDMADVLGAINAKMIARHPHVFGDVSIKTAEEQTRAWEERKAAERAAEAEKSGTVASVLDGVAAGLPALTRAEKLQKRAARIGFDWPEAAPVFDKVREELDEVSAELAGARDPAHLDEEVGDLLFACANLARHLGVEPEGALRRANAKFERRFKRMEDLARGDSDDGSGTGTRQQEMPTSLERLEALWQRVKAEEGTAPPS